jgi:hypothetical protein
MFRWHWDQRSWVDSDAPDVLRERMAGESSPRTAPLGVAEVHDLNWQNRSKPTRPEVDATIGYQVLPWKANPFGADCRQTTEIEPSSD